MAITVMLAAVTLCAASLPAWAEAMPGSPAEAPPTALTGELRLEYEAYFGGLHIGSARADLTMDAGSYRVTSEARARGILDWFSGWRGTAESRGRLADGAPKRPWPELHRNWGVWDEDPRWAELRYDAQGRVAMTESSPPDADDDERTPIPEASTADTIDPITAIIAVAHRLAGGGPCDARLPLYDGRRRYDAILSDGGTAELGRSDYSVFAGPARACQVEVERIGGFRVDRSRYSETARDRTIWVARPLEMTPPVPVRVEVETAYGNLVIHLVGVYRGERKLALEPGRDIMADEE